MHNKKFIILSSILVFCFFGHYLKGIFTQIEMNLSPVGITKDTFNQDELNFPLFEIKNGDIKFKFTIGKLIQGVNDGELPFHYYTHPDAKVEFKPDNPGIVTSKDFLIWVGCDFKNYLSKSDSLSKDFEQKGLVFVQNKADKNLRTFQMILASYYFYFKSDTRKGLFWAQKAAELGETGSMVILGDALILSNGVIQDRVEGLKWYIIASSLGALAAQGRLLASHNNTPEFREEHKLALLAARAWMESHKQYFISD